MAEQPIPESEPAPAPPPRAPFPWRRLRLPAAVIAVVLITAYVALSFVVVRQALTAEREPIESTPASQGLAYQDVSFSPRGDAELTLRGWFMPASPSADAALGTVVFVHGIDRNREWDLGLLAGLVERGFSVLAFDLRGHGASDDALMGAGLAEQDDVRGAVDYLLAQGLGQSGRIFLYGISYGGAIALLTGVDEPAVAGVYADSAFADLSDVLVKEVADRTVLPRWAALTLRPGIVWMARLTKGVDITKVRPVAVVGAYPYRLGLTHCLEDTRISVEQAIALWGAAPRGGSFTLYPNCDHAGAYEVWDGRYLDTVTAYFDERLISEGLLAP
ncbi:MAG: alpha/beta fold hydrolase [Chloroflexota bacterium]